MKNSILGKARWLLEVALATSKNNGARVAREWLKYAAMLVILFSIGVGSAWGAETLVYTLNGTTTSTGNAYGTESTVTQSSKVWKVMGNTEQNPWRIGGNRLSSVERTIYSTSTLTDNISKITVEHGTATSITVNSMTVIVSANSDFSSPTSTLTPTFVANNTVTINRPSGANWSNKYFKIVYNVSVSGSTNRYIQFKNAKFYKEDTPTCTKTVTLADGSPSHGTISFSPVGPVATCDGSVNVTMTITPDAGYYLSAYSSSGVSTSNTPSITTGTSATTAQTPTLTFAQEADGTYTAGATFTALIDHFIDNIQGTSGFTGEGKAKSGNYSATLAELTLSDGDKTTGSSCRKEHYHFVGWVTAATRTSKSGGPYVAGDLETITGTATGTTYYAVWAMEDDE